MNFKHFIFKCVWLKSVCIGEAHLIFLKEEILSYDNYLVLNNIFLW